MSLPSLTVLQECVYRPNRGQHAAAAAWFGTTAERTSTCRGCGVPVMWVPLRRRWLAFRWTWIIQEHP